MRHTLFIVGLAVVSGWSRPALAQSFLTPIQALSYKTDSYVILEDGTRHEGRLKAASLLNGKIGKLTFETADGEVLKAKAEEIRELGNEPSQYAKNVTMLSSAGGSITNAVSTDYAGISARDLVVFQRVDLNNKGRYGLLQLLNPSFDEGVAVYLDPTYNPEYTVSSGPVSFTIADQTFLLVRGGETLKFKGSKYGKLFGEIFAGCDAVLQHESVFNKKGKLKPNAEHFAMHVALYGQSCGTRPSTEARMAAELAPAEPPPAAIPVDEVPAEAAPVEDAPVEAAPAEAPAAEPDAAD